MRATHACLVLFQLLALSDASSHASSRCSCGPAATQPQNTTTALPDASSESNTTTAAPVVTTEEVTASAGPSSGPARILMDMYDADDIDRELQQDGPSNGTTVAPAANATTEPPAAEEEEEEEECVCPPEVITTFTATLSLGTADDLAALDFDAIKSELVSSLGWGEDVEMVPVMKIGVEYTLDVDISEAQCKAAVAAAYGITEDDVECGDAAAAPASAPAPAPAPDSAATSTSAPAADESPAPAPAPAPTRRLRRLQAVKAVSMSFTDAGAAADAATASQDTTQFTEALAAEGVVATASVNEATVSVELTFTVTADAGIEEPTPASLETAVSTASSITVTAAVSGFGVSYTRMPCSASDICGAGYVLVDDANTIACEGEACTEAERDICCSQTGLSQGGAQGTCAMGSLVSVLVWQFF